jgi:hypothetical protein
MRALVFADRSAAALAPLDKQYAVAMLPMAGKELILYRLEELVAPACSISCSCCPNMPTSSRQCSAWRALGRSVPLRAEPRRRGAERCLATHQARRRRAAAGAARRPAAQPLRRPNSCAMPRGGRATLIRGGGRSARIAVAAAGGVQAPGPLLDLLHWASPVETAADAVVPLADGDLNLIETCAPIIAPIWTLVGKRFRGLSPAGREVALGLIAGRRAVVSPRSLKQGQAYVGDQSRVSPEAELIGEVMIAREVVVDRAATLATACAAAQLRRRVGGSEQRHRRERHTDPRRHRRGGQDQRCLPARSSEQRRHAAKGPRNRDRAPGCSCCCCRCRCGLWQCLPPRWPCVEPVPSCRGPRC